MSSGGPLPPWLLPWSACTIQKTVNNQQCVLFSKHTPNPFWSHCSPHATPSILTSVEGHHSNASRAKQANNTFNRRNYHQQSLSFGTAGAILTHPRNLNCIHAKVYYTFTHAQAPEANTSHRSKLNLRSSTQQFAETVLQHRTSQVTSS